MTKILLIDSKKGTLVTLKAIINRAFADAFLYTALSGPEGIEIAKSNEPDVILLGILTPDLNGFEVCRNLKQDESLQDIPVVFLIESKSDRVNQNKALESGADGFLAVPFDESELIAQVKAMTKIKASNKLKRNEQQLEQLIAGRTHAPEISKADVPNLLIDLEKEIESRKATEEALRQSEAQFRNFFENAADAIFIAEIESQIIVDANQAACKLLLKPYDKIVGLHQSQLHPSDESEISIKAFLKAAELSAQGIHNNLVEIRVVRSDGQLVPVEILASLVNYNGKKCLFGTFRDISERRKTETALRQSEERQHLLLNKIDEIIYSVSIDNEPTDQKVVFVSKQSEQILGYKPDEFIANQSLWFSIIHPDDLQAVSELIQKAFLTKQNLIRNYRAKHKLTGEYIWIEDRPQFLFDESGKIIGVFGSARNITEKKRAEEAWMESQQMFRNLTMISPVGIFRTRADGYTTYVNPRWCELSGISSEEAIGDGWLKAVHPDDREAAIDDWRTDVLNEQISISEYRFLKPDGTVVWVKGNAVPEIVDNVLTGYIGTITDITANKEAEAALRESEEKYRILIENQNDLIVKVDAKGAFLFVSPSYCKMFGKSESELLGNHFIPLVHEDDRQPTIEAMELLKVPPFTCNIEQRAMTVDGWKWLEWADKAVLDEHGEIDYVIGVGREISERKQSDEMIQHERIMLRTLIDNLPDPIYILDKEGRKVVANKADVENIGYSSEAEALGKNDLELFPGKNGKRGHADNMSVITSGNPILHREENFIDKNGVQRWLLTSKFPIYDARGQITGLVGIGYDITERKRADDFLIRSEEKYRLLFKNNPQTMWIFDLETLAFLEVNDAAVMKYGYSKEEFLNMTLKDIRPEEDIDRLLIDASNAPDIYNSVGEWRHKTKKGDIRFVEITSHLIEFENKSARLVLVNDITDRKTVQEEIIKSKEIYKAFFDDDLTGDFISSVDGKLIDCNPAYLKMLGFSSREQAMQIDLSSIYLGHSDRSHLVDMVREQGRLTEIELELIRVDGKPLYAIANIIGSFNEQGKLESIKGYIIDNTKRKLAEMELIKLSRAVEQNPASIIITDVNGNIEYVNPKFSQLTGYSFDEVVGKNPRLLKSGFTPDEDYTLLWKSILSGKEWQGEFQNRKKNGEFYYESVLISPIHDEKGNIMSFLAVKEDITGKKLLMEDLIAAKEKAEESDRLKSSFLANMSHEIRTPMNGILGFMSLLQEPNLTGDERDEYIKIVKISGNRLLSTINDIIDISKIESGQSSISISETNVNNIMQQLYRFFLPEAEEKGLGFQINELLPENYAKVQTDGYKLESVLVNLIKNALKFTRTGAIGFGCHIDGNMIRFTVTDTGVGIPPNRKGSIFDRFVQAETSFSRPFEGSGLGLSISKAYVEMLGGEIKVKSELGKGSEFTFTIQYQHVQTIILPTLEQSGISMVEIGSDTVILVAEDDDISFFFLKKLLANEKLRLVRAPDGMEAVRLCKDLPEIALVLMDIKMPMLDGYEATRRILKFRPDLPIIALTAYAFPDDNEKAINCGCVDYLSKPLSRDKLFKVLAMHLGKG